MLCGVVNHKKKPGKRTAFLKFSPPEAHLNSPCWLASPWPAQPCSPQCSQCSVSEQQQLLGQWCQSSNSSSSGSSRDGISRGSSSRGGSSRGGTSSSPSRLVPVPSMSPLLEPSCPTDQRSLLIASGTQTEQHQELSTGPFAWKIFFNPFTLR